MPEYLAPGVHVEELPSAPPPIERVRSSTAGMVGLTARGPVGVPTRVTSLAQFGRIFGGVLDPALFGAGQDALPHAVEGFFANGGTDLHVVRVIGEGATQARTELPGEGGPCMKVFARDPGACGNAIRLTVTDRVRMETTLARDAAAGATALSLTSTAGLSAGDRITVGDLPNTVDHVTSLTDLLLQAPLSAEATQGSVLLSLDFDLRIERLAQGAVAETEVFTGLSLAPGRVNPAPERLGSCDAQGGSASVTGDSQMVRLCAFTSAHPAPGVYHLGTGSDGTISDASVIGTASETPSARRGIEALANASDISLVAVPGQVSLAVQAALMQHCDRQLYRFAVLDMALGATLTEARAHRNRLDGSRGAIYHPWLTIPHPMGPAGAVHAIPPSGHVLGIYARCEAARGIWATPANEEVRGILGFQTELKEADQQVLTPLNINCLRDFRSQGRGLRVWGGRTLSSDPEWRHVAVRRSLLCIEQSLDRGLQFAVFEPNGPKLWDAARQATGTFLDRLWHDGGLVGSKAQDAYFLRVGLGETMRQADLDAGLMIVEVGVAPLRPAEFIVIRLTQKTRLPGAAPGPS